MKKNMQIIVILIVVALAIFVVFGFFGIGGLNFFNAPAASTSQNSAQALLAEVQQTGSVSQLETADIVVGNGDTIAPGDTIQVAYTGVLTNGTVFDSTDAHGGTPLTLVVGPDGSLHTPDGGSLIAGWSLGMAGMKDGGVRLLAIPPSLGYGANAVGSIPANSTLIFQVAVTKVTPQGSASGAASTTAQ
jgi:peptidylprolyl isomerase/FKBP-type peptidyl-prolyl cis-trans isomerase FkpA